MSVAICVYTYVRNLLFLLGDLSLPVPYDINDSPILYEITVLLQSLAAILGFTKQFSADGLFFAVLFYLTLCTNQLGVGSESVCETETCRAQRRGS